MLEAGLKVIVVTVVVLAVVTSNLSPPNVAIVSRLTLWIEDAVSRIKSPGLRHVCL